MCIIMGSNKEAELVKILVRRVDLAIAEVTLVTTIQVGIP